MSDILLKCNLRGNNWFMIPILNAIAQRFISFKIRIEEAKT